MRWAYDDEPNIRFVWSEVPGFGRRGHTAKEADDRRNKPGHRSPHCVLRDTVPRNERLGARLEGGQPGERNRPPGTLSYTYDSLLPASETDSGEVRGKVSLE